jgi:hypothetical protein
LFETQAVGGFIGNPNKYRFGRVSLLQLKKLVKGRR